MNSTLPREVEAAMNATGTGSYTLDLTKFPKEKRMNPNDVSTNLPAHYDPANAGVKPNYRSTEFWLKVLALVIGLILTSGVLDVHEASNAKVIDALVAVSGILAALGYAGLRTSAKNTAAEGAAAVAIAKVNAAAPAVRLLESIASAGGDGAGGGGGISLSVPPGPAST